MASGVMKKCTLCIDRIYNENIPEIDRLPACVRACPTGARAFGDISDPESDAGRLVVERGGVDLMPEQGTKPQNKYLPPRGRDAAALPQGPNLAALAEPQATGFLGWLDRALERLG